MIRHAEEQHGLVRKFEYRCDVCGRKYKREDFFRQHMLRHEKNAANEMRYHNKLAINSWKEKFQRGPICGVKQICLNIVQNVAP